MLEYDDKVHTFERKERGGRVPIHYEFDAELKVLCATFGGKFSTDEPLQVLSAFVSANPDLGTISILNVFSRDSDLSDASPDELYKLRDDVRDLLAENGIVRERTAFVMNGSIDILMLGPLWQAINAADPNTSFPMRFFNSIGEASEFLGADLTALRELVARTEMELRETAHRLG